MPEIINVAHNFAMDSLCPLNSVLNSHKNSCSLPEDEDDLLLELSALPSLKLERQHGCIYGSVDGLCQ